MYRDFIRVSLVESIGWGINNISQTEWFHAEEY